MTAHNGMIDLEYNFTAYHGTDHTAFYITKENYDPTRPLSMSDLELLCREDGELPPDAGGRSGPRKFTNCKLPSNQSGRHLIFAAWPVSAQHGINEVFTTCGDVMINNDQGSNPGPGWETVNPQGIQANEDIEAGTKAIFRLFDKTRNGAVEFETSITADKAMVKSAWIYQLANKVNTSTKLVRIGKLNNNTIELIQGKTQYDVFSKDGSKYSTAILVEKKEVENPGGEEHAEQAIPVIQLTSDNIVVDKSNSNQGYALDASLTENADHYRWEIIEGDSRFQLQKKSGEPTYHATPLEGSDLHTVRA